MANKVKTTKIAKSQHLNIFSIKCNDSDTSMIAIEDQKEEFSSSMHMAGLAKRPLYPYCWPRCDRYCAGGRFFWVASLHCWKVVERLIPR